MTTFRVGMKCVCVNDYGEDLSSVKWPMKGAIYTISYVHHGTNGDFLTLAEIPNPHAYSHRLAHIGWWHLCFRPLVTRTAEQDAELFQPWLTPDPLDIATLYERDFADTEARLERLWTAMRSFEL